MAPDDGSKTAATWPMPRFRFEVDLGNELKGIPFQEVTGLDIQSQIIEYRKTDKPVFSAIKMPGIAKFGNITMKKGIFVNDKVFWDWLEEIKMKTVKKRKVLISLVDEKGNKTMQWQLANAWPTKITSTDLKSDGNEVAIETLELAHEGLKIRNEW